MDTIRILRILEYVGPRESVEKCLEHNVVKGTKRFGDITIRSATMGDFPEKADEKLKWYIEE